MKITFDKEADAVYIEFSSGEFSSNKKIDDETIIDLDKNSNILGIELLNVSKRIIIANMVNVAGMSRVTSQVNTGNITIAPRLIMNNWFGSTETNISDILLLAVEVKVFL